MSTHSDIFADNAPPIDMDRLSFVTDTDATEDDILGPGRSLNCLLTSWGFRLDRLLITLARRMGYGPQERVSRALRQCATMRTLPIQSSSCRHQHAVSDELAGIPHHANLDKMLKWISDAPSLLCTMCRDRTVKVLVARSSVRRACQELVHLLNGPNVSSRVISVHYIMALVSFHVAFLDLFASLNAVTSLLRLRTILYLEQECESASLVSSSRRALACLTQSRVLNQIKEFDSLDACITLSGKELHLTRDDTIFTEYMGHLRRTSSHIIELTSDPDVQILAITRLRRFFVTWTSIWFKSSMVDELTFDVVQRWWRCLGECKDHTLQAALTDFLVSLYGPWFWTARPDTLEILLRPLLCFRAQHPDLCEGGGAVQAAAQTIQIGFRRNILWHPAPPMREELNSLKDRLEPGQLMGLMDASDPAASLLLIWEDHPLGGPCQMSFRERAMSSLDLERWINRGGIRREIPPGALEAICKNTVSLILSLSFSSTMMRDVEFIAPLWDKRVRLALASRLKAAAAETSTEVPEVLQEWLSRDVRDDLLELRCTGIVVGSLTDCGRKQPKVYDDHYRHPHPTFRHYRKDMSYARLIAPFRGREHLRRVSLASMGDGYHPVVLPFGRRHEHIGLYRQLDGNDQDGALLTLSENLHPIGVPFSDELENEEMELHILASTSADAAIYWVTRDAELVHAMRQRCKEKRAMCNKGAFIACTCGFQWDD